MKPRKTTTVAISGFAGTLIAEPGGAVASALRKAFGKKIKIIALAYTPWANAAFTPDLVDEIYLIQLLNNNINHHYDELSRVFTLCKPDIYIPTLELEVKYLRHFIHNFREVGPKALIPEVASYDQASKLRLHYFCQEHAFLYPRTMAANNSIEFNYLISGAIFPCLIKSALNGAELVHSIAQAYQAAQRLSSVWQQPVLIQNYIEGDQYMVAALCDNKGKVMQTVSAKKHLVNFFGKSAISITVDNPKLEQIARDILEKILWSGPLELEFIQAADGNYYLFEINPRFPSWVDIGTSLADNLPALLVNYLQDHEPLKSYHYEHGQVLLRDTDEVCVSLENFYQLKRTGVLKCQGAPLNSPNKTSKRVYTLAITGASSHHLPMPGPSVANALHRSGINLRLVYLAESYQDTSCYRDDLFDCVYPFDSKLDPEEVFAQIAKIHRKNKLDAIIPTLDRQVELFTKIAAKLQHLGIRVVLPNLENIQRVYQFPLTALNKTHPSAPLSQFVKHHTELPKAIAQLGYPIVLKALGPEKSCMKTAYTAETIGELFALIDARQEAGYILQQFIEGEHFAVCGLAAKGKLLECVVIKSIQSCVYGKIWMATQLEGAESQPFITLFESLVKELHWHGPLEIDCLREKYSERLYCIDVNPRFPSWAFYTGAANNKLMKRYVQLLLEEDISWNDDKSDQHIYMKMPRNYYSNTKALGILLSGKELQYHG